MAKQSTGRFGFIVLSMVIGAGLLVAGISSGWLDSDRRHPEAERWRQPLEELNKPSPPAHKVASPTLSQALGVKDEELVEIGGIKRPKRDLAFVPAAGQDETDAEASQRGLFTQSLFPHPGSAPAVPIDAHPEVAALRASLADRDGPMAARSALFPSEPFDLEAYQRDRDAWLKQIQPGRVFDPAQPGEEVQPIATRSPIFQQVLQGERVNFEVKIAPGMPVTFYTPQVGEFPNRLTTHSVAANEEGIARTTWLAGPGTLGIIDIMAASPIHSGILRYKVRVSLPD